MNIKDLSKTIYQDKGEGFTSRMHLVVNAVEDGSAVLEVGVGEGELIRNLRKYKNIKLYAIDAAEMALKSVKTHLEDSELIDVSSEKMKFSDNFFDAVICLEVFEHLQNPYYAIMEIQRVLKPGGKLLISIPNCLGGHIAIYPGLITQKFFQLFLRQNYFKITDSRFWGPVWNKDNLGILLESKIRNKLVTNILLRFIQVSIKVLQFISSLFFIKIKSLYWCYFYVCENKKNEMEKSFWITQLEQTSELGEYEGWYNEHYHRKV